VRTESLAITPPQIKEHEFLAIRQLAYEKCGLDLRQGKERLVTVRLGKHLRAGGFKSFSEYFRSVQADTTGESLIALINALTTNHTSFLREPDHFRFVNETILPELAGRKTIRIWSAASSTGEEPYSILFSVLDKIGPVFKSRVEILASDISTRVLNSARLGRYPADRVRQLPPDWVSRYLRPVVTEPANSVFEVQPDLRARVEFRRINLIEPITGVAPQPVIFCRNVMIYFDRKTQAAVVNRLTQCLEPGGYLLIGHSESLNGLDHTLKYVRPAVYRRMH
jgi:chemotaxis protein methyltransferase CheR